MSIVKRLVVRTLGLPPVSGIVQRLNRSKLRIVAYHGVDSSEAFEQQLKFIVRRYRPVSGARVVQSLRDGETLPANAVWLTFDDGLASVVTTALPLLQRYEVPATMFVCPGLATAGQAPWWETIRLALEGGWRLPGVDAEHVLRHLKSLPDSERRAVVQDAAAVDPVGPAADPTASESALDVWQRAGYELGNHTWDHPCLDHCDPEEQTRQIVLADEWLVARGAFDSVRLFAYPNGDWTQESERTLVERRYSTALLFDHKTVDPDSVDSIRLSRLRLDADAPVHRARAVLSGSHSWLYSRS